MVINTTRILHAMAVLKVGLVMGNIAMCRVPLLLLNPSSAAQRTVADLSTTADTKQPVL